MKSPFSFALDPIRVDVEDLEYSLQNQSRLGIGNESITITFGGTRTFDMNGRPYDNDND